MDPKVVIVNSVNDNSADFEFDQLEWDVNNLKLTANLIK